jgi:hypothetical protein
MAGGARGACRHDPLKPVRLSWIIPWTSTLSVFLIIRALFLLDRYLRLREKPDFTRRDYPHYRRSPAVLACSS